MLLRALLNSMLSSTLTQRKECDHEQQLGPQRVSIAPDSNAATLQPASSSHRSMLDLTHIYWPIQLLLICSQLLDVAGNAVANSISCCNQLENTHTRRLDDA